MTRVIAYDIMRLSIGPAFLTPRGIDRVDLALARHLFAEGSDRNVGVLPTPIGVYAFSASEVRRLLVHLQGLWSENIALVNDLSLQRLMDKIAMRETEQPLTDPVRALDFRHQVARMLRMLGATGLLPRRFASRAVPQDAVYLNIGQLGLAMPSFFAWLEKRPDITRAMMVHDAIPIDFPHLVSEKAPVYHRQMIRTATEHADCLIFNSAYTRDSVGAVVQYSTEADLPALVRALPLPAAFIEAEVGVAALSGTRFFLAVSTVEPRKNYELLLRVWRDFVATLGTNAPHLVIVGAPGREAEAILAPLEIDAALATRVHHVVGLSSPGLASLVLGATGVLCPSLAEGFGLPLLEASAMGVPVIASDIPAHREVADASTTLLPTDDDAGWARAILQCPEADKRKRPPIPSAMTEAAYCDDIVQFVCGVRARSPISPRSAPGKTA